MGASSTQEMSSAPSREPLLGCSDCLLHLTHHVLTEECLDYIIRYFDYEYDQPFPLMSRVDRYYAEYETRLLGLLTEGRDECGVSEP